ncbi:MAG: DUF1569 domain-containing protein [Acidobacteriota bacterium]
MNLFIHSDRQSLIGRLESLGPDSVRRWGKMSPPQALAHLGCQIACALGELDVKPVFFPAIPGLRYLIVHVLPFPKGVPTAPELIVSDPKDLDTERRRVIDLIERAYARGPEGPFEPHPAFGRLSGKSWGVLMARHLDHHLRQFSA